MSNYCKHCPCDPKQLLGEKACPFNALYWDFLARNKGVLSRNPRMALSYKNLDRKTRDESNDIRKKADAIKMASVDGTL
jgi:deoxyribodipyrimidine photolyase-related protein